MGTTLSSISAKIPIARASKPLMSAGRFIRTKSMLHVDKQNAAAEAQIDEIFNHEFAQHKSVVDATARAVRHDFGLTLAILEQSVRQGGKLLLFGNGGSAADAQHFAAELVERFSWVLYGFGAFLLYAGIHMLFVKKEKVRPEQSAIFRFASKHLRISRDYQGEHFFVRSRGKLYATPLFIVLLVIEITDVTLAVDSIPAIFGITRDAFIVYTSNVFAILGLRAMYFLLAGVLNRLRFLTVGLSFVLSFIGAKMLAQHWVEIPQYISLIVVGGILLAALGASLLFPAKLRT